jgi:Rap1a immunity proteins
MRYTAKSLLCLLGCVGIGAMIPMEGQAETLTGNDFLKLCVTSDPNSKPKDQDENDEIIRCLAYFEGTVTTMLALNGAGFCIPGTVRPTDIMMNTINWLNAHPDQKKYAAASVVVAGAQEKWPCRHP